jgi:hypothetical protein
MRRLCRAAGLRVRTGVSEDGTVAWALHADHVVTAAEREAASRAIETALEGECRAAPFRVLVRQAQRVAGERWGQLGLTRPQREMLRLVPVHEPDGNG